MLIPLKHKNITYNEHKKGYNYCMVCAALPDTPLNDRSQRKGIEDAQSETNHKRRYTQQERRPMSLKIFSLRNIKISGVLFPVFGLRRLRVRFLCCVGLTLSPLEKALIIHSLTPLMCKTSTQL